MSNRPNFKLIAGDAIVEAQALVNLIAQVTPDGNDSSLDVGIALHVVSNLLGEALAAIGEIETVQDMKRIAPGGRA